MGEAVSITGTDLPRFGNAPDAAVGLTAPKLVGTSFDGSEVRIEPSGKYQVVMFLAHWCSHCMNEVEQLGPYFETTPLPGNVEVYSVSTGTDPERPNYPPSEWLTADAWPLPVLVDTEDRIAATAYGLNAFPFWVVLDEDGVVLGRTAGSLPIEAVESLFAQLAGGL